MSVNLLISLCQTSQYELAAHYACNYLSITGGQYRIVPRNILGTNVYGYGTITIEFSAGVSNFDPSKVQITCGSTNYATSGAQVNPAKYTVSYANFPLAEACPYGQIHFNSVNYITGGTIPEQFISVSNCWNRPGEC